MATPIGVQEPLGHASIVQTPDVCGHLLPERHEHQAERLDQFLKV